MGYKVRTIEINILINIQGSQTLTGLSTSCLISLNNYPYIVHIKLIKSCESRRKMTIAILKI